MSSVFELKSDGVFPLIGETLVSGEKPLTFLFPSLRLDWGRGLNGLSSVLGWGRAKSGLN